MRCHFAALNRTPIACNYLAFMGVLKNVILGCTRIHLMCCMDVYFKKSAAEKLLSSQKQQKVHCARQDYKDDINMKSMHTQILIY